jgi:hypothetical protein
MPSFTLCYKQYDYEVTLAASKEFKQETGKCLIDFICLACSAYVDAKNASGLLKDRTVSMMQVVPSDDCAFALYCLAKTKNRALTFEEVWDATMKTQFVESGDGKNEPVQIVAAQVGINFINQRQELDSPKDSAERQGDTETA